MDFDNRKVYGDTSIADGLVSVSVYRAAAGVKEPVCIFPVEKIALWKLLAACHLENDNIGDEDHDHGDDFLVIMMTRIKIL